MACEVLDTFNKERQVTRRLPAFGIVNNLVIFPVVTGLLPPRRSPHPSFETGPRARQRASLADYQKYRLITGFAVG